MKVLLSLLGALISAQQCSSEVKDLTMTPGANGEDVARATFAKVWDEVSTWNAKYEERDFFIRYAYADSSFGSIMHHPIQQIWSISEGQFNTTKTVAVKNKVSSTFNVDWDLLEYDELTVPTYSALALFLYLEHSNEFPIPFSIDDQAEIYHRITNFPVDGFKDGVNDIDQITQNECMTMALDIVFVVDESGSVGLNNFELVKDFLWDYASDSNIASDATRIAIRPFSSNSYLYFALNDFKSKNILNEIKNMPYNGGGTNTASALDAALTDYDSRQESIKVMVTVTDGASGSLSDTTAAANRVKNDPRNIQSFAIGVAGANLVELNAIGSSTSHVFMLNGWADFEPIKQNLQSMICAGNIENNNGGDTQVGGSAGTPGKITMKIGMSGKDNYDFMADAPLTFFFHRNNPAPGPAAYEKTFNVTSSNVNQWINHNIGPGYTYVFLSAYNYKPSKALVSLRINAGGTDRPLDPAPKLCQENAFCDDSGLCNCHDQYSQDADSGECVFDRCASVDCFNGYQCAPATGSCFCPDDHLEHDGKCYAAECPETAVKVYENEFGYSMGELSSPWREHRALYPTNFDCTYEFETIRAEGSCYEVLLEHPFGIEASSGCQNDRLEIHGVLNADQAPCSVNMDHSGPNEGNVAVMCGDACVAEGGWVGKVCGDKLKIRFKSDHMVEDIGWKIKWVLRPAEDCGCFCECDGC